MRSLILASSSPHRRSLLKRLQIPFESASPATDESQRPGEPPETLVERLSCEKAQALMDRYPASLIIGSDQVATLDHQVLTKPGNRETATLQLRHCSGREVTFYTGLCLLDARAGQTTTTVVSTLVSFRQLTDRQIQGYIDRDMPFDCAGSFKCESLGIGLFESIRSDDPTALVGLPLITLTSMLQEAAIDPLG